MFLVVEFRSSGDVVVIPDSWTTNQRRSAWWPPYQSAARLNNAVRSREVPGEGWGTGSIRTIHEADSYNKARRKLTQAEQQPPAEAHTDGGVTLRRSKRRRRPPVRYTDAEEDPPQPKRRRKGLTKPATESSEGTSTRKLPALPLPTSTRRSRRAPAVLPPLPPPPPTPPPPTPPPPPPPPLSSPPGSQHVGAARRTLSNARGTRILTILKEILAEQRSIRRMIERIMMHEGILYEEEGGILREE